MNPHYLPYVLGSYTIAIGAVLIFTVDSLLRVRRARRMLEAVEPRRGGL